MRRNILITGTSGFIGRWMLYELGKEKNNHFFLITRPPVNRIQKIISGYPFSKDDHLEDRIKIIEGDTGKKKLGISKKDYTMLISETHDIFHFAAASIHSADFEKILAANLEGTKQVIDLSRECLCLNSFNFASSFAVSVVENNYFQTNKLARNWPKSGVPYILSKIRSEELIKDQLDGRFNVNIIRIPQVFPDSVQAQITRWDDAFVQMIASIIKNMVKKIPMSSDLLLPGLQIDYLVKMMKFISQRKYDKTSRTYSIIHPHQVNYSDLIHWTIEYFNIKGIEFIPLDEFRFNKLSAVEFEIMRYFFTLLLPGFFARWENDSEVEKLVRNYQLTWPPQDKEYFNKIFKSIANV